MYLNLLHAKFQFSNCSSIAEETGLSLALSETPKTGFVTLRPKCRLSRLEFTNDCQYENREDPDQTDSSKQSDLSLPCLSITFLQAISVRNYRTFTIHCVFLQ